MGTTKLYFSSKKELVERLLALQEVAVDLLKERDSQKLLQLVVDKGMKLLTSDGGAIYIADKKKEILVHRLEINKTNGRGFIRKNLELATSREPAAFTFNTKKSIRVEDVYKIDESKGYQFDKSADKQNNYRTKTLISYPLYSSHDELLGVIVLYNHKRFFDEKWPGDDKEALKKMPFYTEEDLDLLRSFASLASAALENAGLYKNIHNLLEGFVTASVKAIETRDLATSGHSERVAILTVDLAQKVSRSKDHTLNDVQFTDQQIREIRYASLLHDFGKIGVKENVLLKSEKLYPEQKLTIENRVNEFGSVGEINYLKGFISQMQQQGKAPTKQDIQALNKKIAIFRARVSKYWEKILKLNTTAILDEDNSELLNTLKDIQLPNLDNKMLPLLTGEEQEMLSIGRGSLSDDERNQINMHVTHTYYFLKQIPWTTDFPELTEIAYAHHEFLNGTGYPRKLKAEKIPIQSQIMTITDIFDALVAWDRPYKRAVPFDRALEILGFEVKAGKLHPEMVKIFTEGKVFDNPEFMKIMNASKQSTSAPKKSVEAQSRKKKAA